MVNFLVNGCNIRSKLINVMQGINLSKLLDSTKVYLDRGLINSSSVSGSSNNNKPGMQKICPKEGYKSGVIKIVSTLNSSINLELPSKLMNEENSWIESERDREM